MLALFGYLAAALAASAFLNVMLVWSLDWPAEDLPTVMAGSAFLSIPFVAIVIAWLAAFPAVVAIAIAEIGGFRDWLYHAPAGAAIALAVVIIADGPSGAENGYRMSTDLGLMTVVAASGLVAGFAYWAIAGRASGDWFRSRVDHRGPPAA